jgi:hypothetical protein
MSNCVANNAQYQLPHAKLFMDEYLLTPEELAELNVYSQPIAELERQRQAVLRLIIRQQHLEGNWDWNPGQPERITRRQE